MAQFLTVAAVKAAARSFHELGLLTAQHPNPVRRVCCYAAGDHRCAVGAAFDNDTTQEVLAGVNYGHDVTQIVDEHLIAMSDADEGVIMAIQSAHDKWCDASRNGKPVEEVLGAEDAFLKLIAE